MEVPCHTYQSYLLDSPESKPPYNINIQQENQSHQFDAEKSAGQIEYNKLRNNTITAISQICESINPDFLNQIIIHQSENRGKTEQKNTIRMSRN